MGWSPGEGLGKNKEGTTEPLLLDVKMDKKGESSMALYFQIKFCQLICYSILIPAWDMCTKNTSHYVIRGNNVQSSNAEVWNFSPQLIILKHLLEWSWLDVFHTTAWKLTEYNCDLF